MGKGGFTAAEQGVACGQKVTKGKSGSERFWPNLPNRILAADGPAGQREQTLEAEEVDQISRVGHSG